jgi:hypothetical protein
MLQVHRAVGLVVIALAVIAAVWGFVAYRRGRAGPTLGHLLALVQTALIAQVALGLLLLSDHHRAKDRLHYTYGTLALAAILSPWVYAPGEPRRRLAWFAGATLLAGALAGRAYMTAS